MSRIRKLVGRLREVARHLFASGLVVPPRLTEAEYRARRDWLFERQDARRAAGTLHRARRRDGNDDSAALAAGVGVAGGDCDGGGSCM